MASSFNQTMRSLDLERTAHTPLRLVLVLAMMAVWVLFLSRGRISVYASTSKGRLEVSGMAHRVASSESGRVSFIGLELGRRVAAGDLLLQLDPSVEQKRLAELQAKLNALPAKEAALRRQIAAEEQVRSWQAKLSKAAIRRARIDLRQRELGAATEQHLSQISQVLREKQAESDVNTRLAQSRAAGGRLEADGARADLRRLRVAGRHDDRRALSQLAELERQLYELQGERAAAEAAVETARAQIARLTVRAPVAGKLGHVAVLQLGDVVKAGDPVATIIPRDGVEAVGLFPPSEVVGRILPGQSGRIRLEGFAWTQYGTLPATVSHVGSEPDGEHVRVELRLQNQERTTVPLQHGMPGSIEIQIDRVSPWILLVRAIASRVSPVGGAR